MIPLSPAQNGRSLEVQLPHIWPSSWPNERSPSGGHCPAQIPATVSLWHGAVLSAAARALDL